MGTICVITDNLSSHDSKSTRARAWLEDHPRHPACFHPQGCLLAEPAGRLVAIFRRRALAGQSFADPDEIAHAAEVPTAS
jgi:hypothetical protein